jgi:Fe2+ transport system protein FeoA
MTLLDLAENDVAEIRALPDDPAAAERLHALGLFAGRKVRFVKAAPFSGPLLVEDPTTGARMMIARSMAKLVEVRDDRSKKL